MSDQPIVTSLLSSHATYLTAELDLSVSADRVYESPGPWELWTVVQPNVDDPHTIALLSHHGGFLCAEAGGGSTVTADRVYDSPGPWEQFRAVPHDSGGYVLLCHDGIHYLTADLAGQVTAGATAIGAWEVWTLTPDPFYVEPPPPDPDGGDGEAIAPGNRVPQGAIRLERRVCCDDAGAFLALGASFFWAPRAFRDYRDRYDLNMAYLAEHGFTYYRAFVLTGGWPEPDAWEHAGAFLPWALEVLPAMLDDAYDRYQLRCSLTLFDGEVQTPTDGDQDTFVRQVCDLLSPRMHTIQDVQVANEYGPCQWDYPKGIERLRRHAQTLRSRLGPTVPIGLSSRSTAMNDGSPDEVYAECHKLFDGLIPDVVTVTVNHDSRDTTKIDGPWRHVRQGWERVVSDPHTGAQLEPDASIDDEPMGPSSSVAVEESPSRIVGKSIVDWISGRHQYCYHTDAGIWSTLLNPAYIDATRGCHDLIADHPASPIVGQVWRTLIPKLPADLPVWERTRHGFDNHPFAASFEQDASGGFSQIWPDQVTNYGVVRAYAALEDPRFLVALTGIKDRIDLVWTKAMTFTVYRCGSVEPVQDVDAAGPGSLTLAESIDTDLLIIGSYR